MRRESPRRAEALLHIAGSRWGSGAGWVPLVLAFSLCTTVTATSEIKVCQWRCKVTGRVDIKGENPWEVHFATIFKGQLCPANVTFNNCTACVNDQSNVTISCQLSGENLPKFTLEFGEKEHGVTDIPDFIGCKLLEEVTEKTKQDMQTEGPSKGQTERQRWSIVASLIFVICLSCFYISYRLWKQCRVERSHNSPCDSTGSPNGTRGLTVSLNGTDDPTVYPNGTDDPTVYPNGTDDPTVSLNGIGDPTVYLNGTRQTVKHSNDHVIQMGTFDENVLPNGTISQSAV